jgi:aspartyl-tRNA synthetase
MRILSKEILGKEGEEVELAGWVAARRDHGKIIFIDLRDSSGIVQLVFTPKNQQVYSLADTLRSEWVIQVKGRVAVRPAGMENNELLTGRLEIPVDKLEVITKAKTPPFAVDTDGREVSEDLRMAWRYLDLRRPRMQKNLRNRHKVIKFMRDYLTEHGFTEVETPILGKSTPEGARDYLVPSRLQPGTFYALPQSPQQYKQLLMVAGLERYFQIARCFRDEDTRGDRQPEFTQLDIEMSFVDQEDVLALIEDLYLKLVRALYPKKKIKLDENGRILRMPYKEAISKYNSDKPDVRDNKDNPDELAFLFVTDFPAFEWKETEKRWDAVHHPFTQPQVKDVKEFWEMFKKDPASMFAKQYDFVLNGYEIGGGSIRIHDPELLAAVFEAMGNKPADIKEKFGHMLQAFEYGVPPHGGIAPGIDRFIMILENEPNIREVIAFPKTGDGRDLMMHAPSSVTEAQLKELNLKIFDKKKE